MPAYSHDQRLVDPDQVRTPGFASVLLVDLGVEHEPPHVQRGAVTRWLDEHDPSPALLASLGRARLVDRAAPGGSVPLTDPGEERLSWLGREAGLTRLEATILDQVARAKSNREIAEILDLAEAAVASSVEQICQKLGVSSRTTAALWAARQIRPPDPPRRTADDEWVQIRLREGRLLAELRRRLPGEGNQPGRSLTQRQAAALLGISHHHYADLERGRRAPTIAVAERLAVLFDVPIHELFEVEVLDRDGRRPPEA